MFESRQYKTKELIKSENIFGLLVVEHFCKQLFIWFLIEFGFL